MPAEHATGVGRGEDPNQMAVLGHQGAADVFGGHVLEHVVERLCGIDDIRVWLEDVSYKQFISWRQAEIRVKRSLEVAVCKHANECIALLHGQMPHPMTQHELSGTTEAVIDFDDIRKRGHHGVCRGHVVHAGNGSKACAGRANLQQGIGVWWAVGHREIFLACEE